MIGKRPKPVLVEDAGPKGFDDFDLRLGDMMRGERATLGKSLLDVQRELKIKATYIAAIENADLSAFETQGFIAGYVRSYARYLGMEPEQAFERFCEESGYAPVHSGVGGQAPRGVSSRDYSEPFSNPNLAFVPKSEGFLSRVHPSAIGSITVLAALIAAIGYGGWSILQEVQRVQLAPVDEAPSVVVAIDPLAPATAAPTLTEIATQSANRDEALIERLYRPQALDVPVYVSRNGPIAAIDPRLERGSGTAGAAAGAEASADEAARLAGAEVQVTEVAAAAVQIMAVRPAWMRVSAADGTVLFEKILDACESYQLPNVDDVASLRTGNSGAVYFVVDGKTYGPAAPGSNVAKGIELTPTAITAKYVEADLSQDRDLERVLTADASGGTPDLSKACAKPEGAAG